MFYTSYYGNRKIKDMVKVSISQGKPYDCDYNIDELKPSWELINEYKRTLDIDKYISEYNKILSNVDVNYIKYLLNTYSNNSGGKDLVLLCWESPDKFCHRHLCASWLRDAGLDISELV